MIKPLLYKSYIQTIINSVGSYQYKNFYVYDTEKNEVEDVLQDGNLSCSIYVSNILHMFAGLSKLIDAPHVTVKTTINKMLACGWHKIDEVRPGAVIHWEEGFGEDGSHEHIGFALSDDEAISSRHNSKCVESHHMTFNNTRKIVGIYWNDNLNFL